MKLVIQNGRLLDPASQTDRKADVVIDAGLIREIVGPGSASTSGADVLDATGKWIVPGLIDMHVHLREPGEEYKEDIASGSRAAAAGGFTAIVAMPNTRPVIDNADLVHAIKKKGEQAGLCQVLPVGAVTVGQAGDTLAPIAELCRAGAVGVSDDGHPVVSAERMRRALEYSTDFGLPVMTHAEELSLSAGRDMHEGAISTRLGLRGIPSVGEDMAVARDVLLAEYTGGRLHVCHVSTAGAVELVRAAKARGARVTAEATPHHFSLTHAAVEGYPTSTKMNPPLREEHDRRALIEGLKDGTLDAVATDHAPHSSIEKDVAYSLAANGIIGLQTALPLTLALVHHGDLPLLTALERLTVGPARALGIDAGTLTAGKRADAVIVDPKAEWQLDASTNFSKSSNSPWWGKPLRGRVDVTVLAGKTVYRRDRNPVWLQV